MAQSVPDCSETTLRQGAACYAPLDTHLVRVGKLYASILELAAVGGADYSADIPGLVEASCMWRRMGKGLNGGIREAVQLFIYLRNAEGAGASIPANLTELMAAISCMKDLDEDTLNAMQHTVECALGHHEEIIS